MSSSTVSFNIRVSDNGTIRSVEVNAKDLQSALNGVGSASSGASLSVSKLGSSLGSVVAKYASWAAVLTVAARNVKQTIETNAQFERSNSELASVLGTSREGVSKLTTAAKELGRTTEFTASEVTALQTSLARLGFTEQQIINMQEPVLKFATAVGTDLASAADFAGAALRAFGLDSSDATHLLDVMAASTSKSALDFSKLQTSISTVGPVAHSFGLSVEDTVTLLGALSNAGFDASSAATAMRNILLNLANSNGKLAKGLGHTAKTFPEIISALKECTEKGIDLNSALEMTDARSVSAFSALISGAGSVEELRKALGNCDGMLNQMSDTMTDNLIGATNGFNSALEGLMLTFQNSNGPMADFIRKLTDLTNKFTDYQEAVQSGGKKNKDKKFDRSILEDFKKRVDEFGSKGAVENYETWVKQANEAYDDALDKFLAHRTQKNKKAMKEAGNYAIALSDMRSLIMAYAFPEIENTLNTDSTTTTGGGGGGLTEEQRTALEQYNKALKEYRLSVERAVEINRAFGSVQTDKAVRLSAMKSGLTALISKYGAEDKGVKALISDYVELRRIDTPLENLDPSKLTGKAMTEIGSKLKEPTEDVKTFVQEIDKVGAAQDAISALGSTFSSLSDVVGEGAAAWLEWGSNLMSAIAQALPAIVSLTAAKKQEANANAEAMATGAGASVASIPFVGPIMAVAAIASVIAALSAIPKFAKGAIAYGPTLGLFGEYPGASHNPEVVAPLSSLTNIIGAAGGGTVEFHISGRDLYGVLERRQSFMSRGR